MRVISRLLEGGARAKIYMYPTLCIYVGFKFSQINDEKKLYRGDIK
jgi:hypothetical protein